MHQKLLPRTPPHWRITHRDRPKFGCGFGTETDPNCSFGLVSVTVPTPHFTFGFGRNYTADDGNWPKLE